MSVQEAEQYIDELIDGQLLVSNLEVPATGENPVDVLIEELLSCGTASPAADVLAGVRAELSAFDAAGAPVPPERYRAIARALDSLPAKADPAKADLDRLFQVDLVNHAAVATLGPAILDEITAGIDILSRLARPRTDDPLRRFREAYLDRYEGREVPLIEALDEEFGARAAPGAGPRQPTTSRREAEGPIEDPSRRQRFPVSLPQSPAC